MKNAARIGLVMGIVTIVFTAGCDTREPSEPIGDKPLRQPLADQRNLIRQVRLDQDEINDRIDFGKLFYAGKHIFSNRFTKEDHYGEGKNGPRRSKQEIAGRGNYPFLRFNGLDSQSCLECHLAIGFAPQPEHLYPMRFAKQPGVTAGGAGFASNAFGLANFGCKDGVETEDCDPSQPTLGFVRSPPHAFGAGYPQKLAQEMTLKLQDLRDKATAKPGVAVALKAKGVSFGQIVAKPDGTIDTSRSNIEGISTDLVVRPFQWKGLTSNLRNFITGAMNFHFSVQPTETVSAGAVPDDKDKKVNEIDEGEITAVAAFLAHLRPPIESSEGFKPAKVKRGKKVFKESDCATCHAPNLEISNPYVTIRDPRNDAKMITMMKKQNLYEAKEKKARAPSLTVTYEALPVMMEHAMLKDFKAKKIPEERANELMRQNMSGFTRNLNLDNGPPETLPRLPSNENGTIDVPLYSDLKRHKMGQGLAESFDQPTDGGAEHTVPGDEFLTRPLWGVADTAPWMHDGRALSLTEAIKMHAGQGSEANESVDKFKKLSKSDKKALITFLSTLRLPIYNPSR